MKGVHVASAFNVLRALYDYTPECIGQLATKHSIPLDSLKKQIVKVVMHQPRNPESYPSTNWIEDNTK